MAYILRVIDATGVSTPQEAEKFIAEQSSKPPFLNPKFTNFTALISSGYPDLSEDDVDGDNDENIWEEGINGNASSGNLKNIAVKSDLLDESLMAAIAGAALAAGLQLYDDEGQTLYHSTGTIIDIRGRSRQF